MRYGSLPLFLASLLTTSSGGRSIFRTTVSMSDSKKFGTTTARSIPKHLFDHYFLLSS